MTRAGSEVFERFGLGTTLPLKNYWESQRALVFRDCIDQYLMC